MARKIGVIIAMLCVCMSLTCNAFAYTTYNEGTMSTTYVQYFEDIVDSLPFNYDYVATRSGQYEYILYAGEDLEYSHGSFVGGEGYVYKFTSTSGYNAQNNYNVLTVENFDLDTNDMMVYSNMGDYPSLDDRGTIYEYAILFALVVGLLCCLIRPIFKYVLRIR